MIERVLQSLRVIPLLLFSVSAGARDPDLPHLRPSSSPPRLQSCEGFFTLGYSSELVIGSEERRDALIRDSVLVTQADVDAFDQDGFARAREREIAAFRKNARFDAGRDLPPGLRLSLRDAAGARELYTAALDEQSLRLREAIHAVDEFENHVLLAAFAGQLRRIPIDDSPADAAELFLVRRSTSFLPGPDDDLALARLRTRCPHARVAGVLWLNYGRANTLIVYRPRTL